MAQVYVSAMSSLAQKIGRNQEAFKKFMLCGLAFFSSFISVCLGIHSLSLFLQTFGPSSLPYILIIMSVVFAGISLFDAALGRKLGARKIYLGMYCGITLMFLGLWIFPMPLGVKVFLFYLVTNLLFAIADIGNMSFFQSFYSPYQAKVHLPVINSFFSIGTLVASLIVSVFGVLHEQVGLGSLPFFLGLSFCFCLLMCSRLFAEKKQMVSVNGLEKKKSFFDGLNRSFRFVFFESKLFRALAIFSFFSVCIHYFVEFKYRTVLAQSLPANELTSFMGDVSFIKSVLSIFVEMFLVKRMLLRFGVVQMLMSYPLSMLLFLTIALIFQFHFLSVTLIFVVFLMVFYGYFLITLGQIYSILPKKDEHEIYFFIRGVLGGGYLFLVSCSLLIYSWNIALEGPLNTTIIYLCIFGAIFYLFRLKRYFQQQLVKNLFGNDQELQLKAIDLMAERIQKNKGENDLRRLLMDNGLPPDVQKRAIHSFAVIGNSESVVDLLAVFERGKPKTMLAALQAINQMCRRSDGLKKSPLAKRLLVEAYERAFVQNTPPEIKLEILSSLRHFELDEVIVFLEKAMRSKNAEMKMNAIETIGSFKERAVIPYLKPFLSSDDLFVRSSAIVGLWQFQDQRVELIPLLAELINRNDAQGKESALFVIFHVGADWEHRYVLELLDQEENKKRSRIFVLALLTLIQLGKKEFILQLIERCLLFFQNGQKDLLQFTLKMYRKLDLGWRRLFLDEIKKLDHEEMVLFAKWFQDSDYSFVEEVKELGG